MFCKRNATYRGLIASFSVLLSGLAGCATMSNLRQSMLSPGVVRSAPLTQRLPSEREALSGRKSDGLTSVAAFLARTSAYQLPSSSAAYVPKRPSIEAMISETTSPENDQLSQVPSPAVDTDVRRRELRSVVVANTTAAIDSPVRREPTLALPIVRAVTVSYRPALESTITSDPVIKPTGNTANQPLAMREPKPEWTIDGVIGWLEQQAARSGDLDGVWPLKFAQLAFHRDSQAAEMPESLPAVTRRILGALMRLVPEIRGVIRDESTPANEALKRVDEMRRMLADRSDPVVSKIASCDR